MQDCNAPSPGSLRSPTSPRTRREVKVPSVHSRIRFSNSILRSRERNPLRGLGTNSPSNDPRFRGDKGDGAPLGAASGARLARGARCPEPRALALRRSTAALAKSRRTWLNPGPRFLGRGHCCPVPVQRAPRRAVLVPPGRGPGVARVLGYEPSPREPLPAPPARRP